MPFTPFIGLSVLVHIVIIVWHKIFDKTSNFTALAVQKATKSLRLGVSLIVFLVFTVILISAFNLVRASIVDNNSNVNLAERLINYSATTYYQNNVSHALAQDNKVMLGTAFISSGITATTSIKSALEYICAKPNKTTLDYNNSVVNYLSSKRQNYSFEVRSIIASTYGIKSYYGSKNQNIYLLQKMIDLAKCQT